VFHGLLTILLWMFTIGWVLYYLILPLVGQVNEYEVVVGLGNNAVIPSLSREETAEIVPTPFHGEERPYFYDGRAALRRDTTDPVWPKLFFYLSLLYIVPMWWSIVLARRILRTVLEKRPFAPENARRLSWIGWIALGLAIVEPSLNYWAGHVVLGQLPGDGVPLTPFFDLNLDLLTGAFFVLVLAMVFRYGAELEAERALTV